MYMYMYMSMCIYVDACICVCIYIYIYIYIRICAHGYTYMHIHAQTQISIQWNAYINTCVCVHTDFNEVPFNSESRPLSRLSRTIGASITTNIVVQYS